MTEITTAAAASALRTRQRPNKSPMLLFMTIAIWTLAVFFALVTVAEAYDERDEEALRAERRAAAKPWLMREFQLVELPEAVYQQLVNLVESQGYDVNWVPKTIFVSPATIWLVTLIVVNAWSWLSYHLSGTWVEASHILVKDTSPKTLKALNGLKAQLGKDAKLFGLTAKQYSQCPSADQNGDLGRFGTGVMAPPFDRLCFDPSTPVGETVGPVQTQFGYHLIYIRKRKF